MPTDSSKQAPDATARLTHILQDVITRRLAGENVSDEQLIDSNGDLMPELASKLRELRLVEEARSLAEHSSEAQHSSALELSMGPRFNSAVMQSAALPGYAILREIHRGGQGVVYLATQHSTRREVAIKVLREGPFAGPHDRMRFEREVHLLAQLRHPNIVAIHDSGITGEHHYFVMDYVGGAPLDRWADAQRSSKTGFPIRDMMRLFQEICDAVNTAHILGVIHRDLKPANVLVDEQGEPRILDFGLAKVSTDGGDANVQQFGMTRAGVFLGSLPWSSPEQARGDNDRVDIRSDVYSLGVMLYQVVTGRFPYDVVGPIDETVYNIQHAGPVRPRSIGAPIDDDAETIILKCLAKEPDRRYQSAGELSREISLYLGGDAIEAKRDSSGYVLRKWLRRHRMAAAVATSVVVLITASAIALGIMYREQSRLRLAAEGESKKAARTTKFLQNMLASVDPNQALGKQVAVRDVLDAASLTLDSELAGEPEVAAAIHRTIGKTYDTLGEPAQAEVHHRAALEIGRRVLGDDHRDTLAAMDGLAGSLEALNRFDESELLFRQCLEASNRVLGENDPATLNVLHNLANLMRTRGRFDEAELLLKQALASSIAALGAEDPETLITKKVLAGLWQDQGKFDLAEPAYREVLSAQLRVLGDKSPMTLGTKQNLAMLLKATGRIDEAEPLYRELIESMREVLPPDHPDTLRLMNSFGRLLVAQGKLDEAEPLFRKTLDTQARVLGEDHSDTLVTMNNLALLLQDQGRLDDAEPLAQRALDTGRQALGDEHPDVLVWMNNLGNLHYKQGRLEEAEALYHEALEGRRRALGEEHSATLNSLANHAQVLADLKRFDQAEPLFRTVVEIRQRVLGDDHPDTLMALSSLTRFLLAAGKLSEAEAVARQVLELRRGVLGNRHPDTLQSMGILGRILVEESRATEAEALLRDALDSATESLPANHMNVHALQVAYGCCLMALRRFDEAEAQLLKGHEGLKKLIGPSHPRVRESALVLAKLYMAWDKPEKAAAFGLPMSP